MQSEKFSKKLTQYSAAAGALLITGNVAQAQQIKYGTIEGGDGNTKLTYNGDYVTIDLNSDGIKDFAAILVKSTSMDESLSSNIAIIYGVDFTSSKRVDGAGGIPIFEDLNLIAINNSNPIPNTPQAPQESEPEPEPIDIQAKKFLTNNLIGPFASSSSPSNEQAAFPIATIGQISGKVKPTAPMDPFNPNSGDSGYLGLALNNGPSNFTYGWAHITVGPDTEWVDFSSAGSNLAPNTPIPAGLGDTVPVTPWATVAGLGLIGLFAYYRKKKSLIVNA